MATEFYDNKTVYEGIIEGLNQALAYERGDETSVIITIREVPVQPSDVGFENSACLYCGNNPRNGGNGICHCILGQQAIY